MASPIVEISDGKIQGNQKTNLDGVKFYSFLAIPFAKPPVGNLRFKAPVPIEPWTGVRTVTTDGNPSYQRNEFSFVLEGSEDCLHLNVFTRTLPSEEQKLKPVMVWIYGGGFMYGQNKSDLYGPEHLLTEDIVLAAVNYRIGFLGFLHLNDTSLDVPGNAGLKDQQLALKWVQKNIKHFNGDASNVTIFGESAGSSSVHYHVLAPSSKGLFHKAIMQSGSAFNPWSESGDYALRFAKYIREDINTEREALELLTNLPVEELHSYQEKFCEGNGLWGIIAPTVEYPNESAFIRSRPTKLLTSGEFNKVPMIVGYCAREGLLFAGLKNIQEARGLPQEKVDLNRYIHPQQQLGKDDPRRQLVLKKYKEFYFEGENAKDEYLFLGDFIFISGIIGAAKQHAKFSPKPVYLYKASIDAGLNMFKKLTKVTEPGTCHADELGYLFQVHLAANVLKKGPVEENTIRRLVKMWTNFARSGNPTPAGNSLNITWKPVNAEEINYLEIGEELSLRKNPEPERMSFWQEIYRLDNNTANYL